MIKLIASDMDGTLIGSDKIISSDNREAIDYLLMKADYLQ